jgi:hypothetical protein
MPPPSARRVWDESQPEFLGCPLEGEEVPAGPEEAHTAAGSSGATTPVPLLRSWSDHRLLRDLHRLGGTELERQAAPSLRLLSDAFVDLVEETLQTLSQASVYYRCARVALLYALSRPVSPAERAAYRTAADLLQRTALTALTAWAALTKRGGSQRWSIAAARSLVAALLALGPGTPRAPLQVLAEPEGEEEEEEAAAAAEEETEEAAAPVVALEPAGCYAAALACPCSGVGFGVARAASFMAALHMLMVRLVAVVFEVHRVGFLMERRGLDPDRVADTAVGMLRRSGGGRDPGPLLHLDAADLSPRWPAARKEAFALSRRPQTQMPAAELPGVGGGAPSFAGAAALLWETLSGFTPGIQRAFVLAGGETQPCRAVAYRFIGDERAWVGEGEGEGEGEAPRPLLPLWRLQRLSIMERIFCTLLEGYAAARM